jgi:predicted AlkP superfamily phosphohydrolase/phosphomutase
MIRDVLVLGWDGAEPNLIAKLLAQGRLPNLARLVATGRQGILRSTIRPESSVAWTSFATGVHPGQHGVFGFMRSQPNSYHTRLVSSADVKIPFFWEVLSQHGYRVGILNMPMTYPPRPVNGWLVCGLMTPSSAATFTYPPELGMHLLKRGYVIDADPIGLTGLDREAYVEHLASLVRMRTKIAHDLFSQGECNMGIVVFTELDRLQHFFWADMDENHPLHPERPQPDAIYAHYELLDSSLGELAQLVSQDAEIIVMSDHGFGPFAKQFYVNAWLIKEGFLKLKKESSEIKDTLLLKTIKFLKELDLIRSMKVRFFGRWSLVKAVEQNLFIDSIDWPNSQAWFTEAGGIRINLKNREPAGAVHQQDKERVISNIIDKLNNIRIDGNPIFDIVARSSDLYHEGQLDLCPDIILVPSCNPANPSFNCRIGSHNKYNLNQIFSSSYPYTGDHIMNGYFALNKTTADLIVEITDLTRHIMSIFNIQSGFRFESEDGRAGSSRHKDEETVKRRLRALGYLE